MTRGYTLIAQLGPSWWAPGDARRSDSGTSPARERPTRDNKAWRRAVEPGHDGSPRLPPSHPRVKCVAQAVAEQVHG